MYRRTRLPLRITLLLCLVLIITVFNAVRLATALSWRATLETYLPAATVNYVAISGAIWSALGTFVIWSFWRRNRSTRLVILLAAGCYAAWAWADRLFVQSELRTNWLFALVATSLLIGYTAAVVLDPRNQPYFRKENYERKPEEQSST